MKKNLGNSAKLLFIIFIGFALMGFKKQPYKIIDKKINEKTYYFAIPNSFCEYKPLSTETFQFVKCYEIELEKQWELSSFSERILIAVNKDDSRIQNITNAALAKAQKTNYDRTTNEEKNNYFFNNYYSQNNKFKAGIIDDKYIFHRIGENQNGDIYNTFESNVFLNKRYFMFNWTQYLTKNEPRLNKQKFNAFIEENIKLNEFNTMLYNLENRKITLSKPKFDNFINYTDLPEFNSANFLAIFVSLFDNPKNKDIKIFKISLTQSNTTMKSDFEEIKKEENAELIKYKKMDFIKIVHENTVTYISHINFFDNITGLISLETTINNDNKNLKDLYKYIEQLKKENINKTSAGANKNS